MVLQLFTLPGDAFMELRAHSKDKGSAGMFTQLSPAAWKGCAGGRKPRDTPVSAPQLRAQVQSLVGRSDPSAG